MGAAVRSKAGKAPEASLEKSAHTYGEPDHRRVVRVGFGLLWVIDALLQLQPGMFRMDMISDIMQPAATGEPHLLAATIGWSIAEVTPHLVVFNLLIVGLQAAIGVLLLTGRPSWVQTGIWVGIVWSALVWWFGEGLGQ